MARLNVEVAFEGGWAQNGEIDVLDFAPTAMALAEMVVSANTMLSGGRTQVRALLRPNARAGSYIAELSLVVPDVVDAGVAATALAGGAPISLLDLMRLLFGAEGVLPTIERYLRPNPAEPTPPATPPGITISEESVRTLSNSPAFLLLAARCTERIGEADQLRVRPAGEHAEHPPITSRTRTALRRAVEIARDDVPSEFESQMVLELNKPALDFASTWGFKLGQQRYSIKMDDPQFAAEVRAGTVLFRAGDTYWMRVLTTTKHRPSGELTAVYRCLEVVRRVQGTGRQLLLPNSAGDVVGG